MTGQSMAPRNLKFVSENAKEAALAAWAEKCFDRMGLRGPPKTDVDTRLLLTAPIEAMLEAAAEFIESDVRRDERQRCVAAAQADRKRVDILATRSPDPAQRAAWRAASDALGMVICSFESLMYDDIEQRLRALQESRQARALTQPSGGG